MQTLIPPIVFRDPKAWNGRRCIHHLTDLFIKCQSTYKVVHAGVDTKVGIKEGEFFFSVGMTRVTYSCNNYDNPTLEQKCVCNKLVFFHSKFNFRRSLSRFFQFSSFNRSMTA